MFSSVTNLEVDSVTFPRSVESPDSSNSLFLGGAGVQGLNMEGKFVTSTVMGVYLDPDAVLSLYVNWKGKTTEELTESDPFFRDIVTGSFEKLVLVTMKQPITGRQYSEEVAKNIVAILESFFWNNRYNKNTETFGVHGKKEQQYSSGEALERFLEIFKNKKFLPGASIAFTLSPNGSLTVAFSNDDSFPKTGETVINNKFFAEAVLESIIGKNGVSPGARLSVSERLAQLMENQGRICANLDETKNKVKEDATKTDQRRCNKDEEN